MIRGLDRAQRALVRCDMDAAVAAAEDVDRVAGPHMTFEEKHLYPAMRQALGDRHVTQLYQEHAAGREAIAALLAHGGGGPLGDETRRRVLAGLRTVLDHSVACALLMSHLDRLDPQQQRDLLASLLALRRRGTRWCGPPAPTP